MASTTRAGRKHEQQVRQRFTQMDDEQLKDAVVWRIRQMGLVTFSAADEQNRAEYALEALTALDLLVDRLIRPRLAF